MPSTDALEIMQLAIDGAATPEQEMELREILKSPEQRAVYDALRDLARELDGVPLVDPPGVRTSVLSQLHPAAVTPIRPRRKIVLAVAYAAAAVVIIAVALHRAMPPARSAAATMVRPDVEEWPVIARQSIAGASMTIRQNGDQLVVEASVAGAGPAIVEWDKQKLSPETGEAVFQNRVVRLSLQRRAGASGKAVITLRLPKRRALQTTIDLH